MTQEYTPKYDVVQAKPDYPGKRGRKPQTKTWQRDRHYAWLKHRAQAQFRGEEYNLTELAWNEIWTEQAWHRRGRGSNCLTLYRLDAHQPWHKNNIRLITVSEKGRYYQEDRCRGGRPRGSKTKQ